MTSGSETKQHHHSLTSVVLRGHGDSACRADDPTPQQLRPNAFLPDQFPRFPVPTTA